MGAGVLVAALAAPAFGLELGQPDDGNLARSETQRRAYDALAEAFGPGANGPLLVVVAAEAPLGRVPGRLVRALAQEPGVAHVEPPQLSAGRDAALLTVVPRTAPQDRRTAELVERLRARTIPAALRGTGARAHVGGRTARYADEAARIAARIPLFAGTVVGLSLLLTLAAFRSWRIALLSAALNLASIAAAYGVVALAFQTEAGARLLGVEVQPVVPYVPLFMFAILFGLSTDYNVFLLSRVREEWDRRGDVADAVRAAGAATRGVIAAAGAIMVAVFLGFATDPDSTIRMTGVGLASAVALDVTLVRLVIAPAALVLMGDRLWPAPQARPAAPGSLRARYQR
jgi:RND superfamily putative drug exporter